MIEHPVFQTEPWCLRESKLDLDLLPHSESLFALSNGHIGWRGNLDEGEPHGLPGAYLNGVYELRPLPYAEAGFGYPDSGETLINITNGKLIRLLVDDEPFDVRYGKLHSHERTLDLRAGVLRRDAEWESPAGRTVRIRSTRLVSLTQRSIAAVCFEVEAVDGPARVVVQSELIANEELPPAAADPRAAAALSSPLQADLHEEFGDEQITMVHTVRRSKLRVGAAMGHIVEGPESTRSRAVSEADLGRYTVGALLQPGETLKLIKFVAYGWSATRSLPAVRDQVDAALSAVRQTGWDGLLTEQRACLDTFWSCADVDIEGDPEIQQAVRFALFHLYQAGVRAEQRAIPAKGLTGSGYDGHAFWDTETFVLQVLTYTAPYAVAHALRWRQSTLPVARERATQLGLSGAAFPWRTISGQECSGYWPAGTAAFHINADIADAVLRYQLATHDHGFERETGLELLVETARLWCSLGHFDGAGQFRIEGVTGPDEYSALADNNVYTNLMAQQNLNAAADAVQCDPDWAHQFDVTPDEVDHWRAAAKGMFVPYDETRGVHPQAEGFTEHEFWDFESTKPDQYPLLLHFPYFQLYRKQVIKQADLVLALHLRGDAFDHRDKARDFEYCEPLTVRDSSLSACSQAVVAAEVGHLRLAYDYLGEAALMDIANLEKNTADGLHLAALAGSWIALVAGFGGMRHREDGLFFAPRLPAGWDRMTFRLLLDGRVLTVEVRKDQATYTLAARPAFGADPEAAADSVPELSPRPEQATADAADGADGQSQASDAQTDAVRLELRHHGTKLTVRAGGSVSAPIPEPVAHPAPKQPPGREPRRR
ncbi:glycoside hydrolase family 65 protein [Actinocrinis sp.]|uniref:glycoside hydrolase family 65 protein n=1 Tax=Actinocrinis sp. TaxID=1920516 RepID=UPI002D662502|nr:glycosyl hydrolase family 65 protein [Actinocrinis sp.]HZP51008.1 glycosyl hydrolase family 65 protein [Actinocrinis sp.]